MIQYFKKLLKLPNVVLFHSSSSCTDMKVITIENSSIKGYHVFKIRPHNDIEMIVTEDNENSYDPYAMVVQMPEEGSIPKELLEDVTREAKEGMATQTVKSIASKTVGRVPANLGKIFRNLISARDVSKITCVSQNKPTLSRIPPARQSYKRYVERKDRRGGGAIIPCKYMLRCPDAIYIRVKEFLIAALK